HVEDPVEHPCDRPGPVLDLTPGAVGLVAELPVTLRPAGVRLAVRTSMAGMPLKGPPEVIDATQALLAHRARSLSVGSVLFLEIAELTTQSRILEKVAAIASHGGPIPLQRRLGLADGPGQTDHRTVRLELRERGFQHLPGPRAAETLQEVHGHVVGRAEAGVQRISATRCECSHRLRVHALGPLHDRVSFDVDPSPPGTSGELGVLPRRDGHARLAVELLHPFQNDGASGHVDAEGKRLRREDRFEKPALEELLHDLLEGGKETRVV
ncbi:hypothetical protein ABE10_00745, partial [Bacillus toyonensis]|nr:hypothetical protein [Bacillus toyonensis]